MMADQVPEPLSRPVESTAPTEPQPNVHPAAAGASSSTPLGTPPSNVGHPGRGKRVLSVLLFLILLGAAGAFGYLWYTNRQSLNQAKADKTAAEQKIAEAEKKQKEAEAKVSATPSPATKTDEEAAKQAAKNYYEARVNVLENRDFKLGQVSVKGAFASVPYNSIVNGQNGPGGVIVMKKVNDSWVVLDTVQQIDQNSDLVKVYGYPYNAQ